MTDEWSGLAEEVFAELFAEDLAELVTRIGSREQLRADVAECARKVAGAVGDAAPAERRLVVAACFTWGRSESGVARNPRNAAKKFQRYRQYVEVPIGHLVRTDRTVKDDKAFPLLAASLRVLDGLADLGEPAFVLNMAVPAIVSALGEDADAVREVLGRGAELAARHRFSGQRVELPVLGNADFLALIAAYRTAIQERRGRAAADLGGAVTDLAGMLRHAMTRTAGSFLRRGPGEPDIAVAFGQYVTYLADRNAAEAARAVHAVLNYHLLLGEPPSDTALAEPDVPVAPGQDVVVLRSEVEQLVGRLVAELFRAAGPETREPLLHWLEGKRVPDEAEDLPVLLRRLRIAIRELDRPREAPAACPAGLRPERFGALVASLAAGVDPDGLFDDHRFDARYVALAALPPLWTDLRHPVIRLVTSKLRAMIGDRASAVVQATVVATHGTRAPMQFVEHTRKQPAACCSVGPRESVPADQVCQHRPWGEIGLVENIWTLGDAVGRTPDAVSRVLTRYQGPWPELLHL